MAQSSDSALNAREACPKRDICVSDVVEPSDVQYPALTLHVEGL
jgi:hypothetical protein